MYETTTISCVPTSHRQHCVFQNLCADKWFHWKGGGGRLVLKERGLNWVGSAPCQLTGTDQSQYSKKLPLPSSYFFCVCLYHLLQKQSISFRVMVFLQQWKSERVSRSDSRSLSLTNIKDLGILCHWVSISAEFKREMMYKTEEEELVYWNGSWLSD